MKSCSRREKEVAKNLPVLESCDKKMLIDSLKITHHNHVITKKRIWGDIKAKCSISFQ